jgi:PAB1-binding protein PBP1
MTPASYLLHEGADLLFDTESFTPMEQNILEGAGILSDAGFVYAFIEIFLFGATYQTHPSLIMHIRPFMNPFLIGAVWAYTGAKAQHHSMSVDKAGSRTSGTFGEWTALVGSSCFPDVPKYVTHTGPGPPG